MSDLFGETWPLFPWTQEMTYLFDERWCVMHFDGGMDEEAAKAAALAEVWEARA